MNPEQEKKYNEVFNQWMNEINQIPELKAPSGAILLNCREANKPYILLEKKYRPILNEIISSAAPAGSDADG